MVMLKLSGVCVERGADINALDKHKNTALMYAAKKGFSEVVQILVERGADLNSINNCKSTALIYAALCGHSEVVQILLERGAYLNAVDNTKSTALIYASQHGHSEAVQILVERGAYLNAVNNSEITALMYAAKGAYSEVVQCLIDGGADVTALDKHTNTALIYAAKGGYSEVVWILLKGGARISSIQSSLNIELQASTWNLKVLETEYASTLDDQTIELEQKEQKLNLLWTEVELWIRLGANVSSVIQKIDPKENTTLKYPQIICTGGSYLESFLFNYFEHFQLGNGFDSKTFDFSHESEFVHLTVEDVTLIFKIQFGGMIENINSVNEFLAVNQNVIRFAEYIQADDLLNKIAERIVTFKISDFDCFWNDFKSLFEGFDKDGNTLVLDIPLRNFSSKLLFAARARKASNFIRRFDESLSEQNYVLDALPQIDEMPSEEIRSRNK